VTTPTTGSRRACSSAAGGSAGLRRIEYEIYRVVSIWVADVLVRAVLGKPAGTIEVAGPGPQDLVDMAPRTLAARGESLRLVPAWRGPFGT